MKIKRRHGSNQWARTVGTNQALESSNSLLLFPANTTRSSLLSAMPLFTHTHCSPPPPKHDLLFLLLLLIIVIQFPSPATAQLPNTLSPPPPGRVTKLKFDKSMAIVLVVLIVVFFLLGCLSVYTRQCTDRRMRGRFDLTIPIVGDNRRHRGLDPEIIETFPTFVYSTVKGLKIGRSTLECAVCLNEFQDDETLRLIPVCSHVFHPQCIDAWLVNQSTCPVCRANLVTNPGEVSFFPVQITDQPDPEPDPGDVIDDASNRNGTRTGLAESPKVNDNNAVSLNQNRPPRSRSTGFRIARLLSRSHSTGHSLVQRGDNMERFTLRLPDEVRNQLVSSKLSRTKSLGVTLTREGSERRGYRTGSVGSNRGRSYAQFERFGGRSDRRGFSWTPSFMSRAGSTRSPKGSSGSKAPVAIDDVGERSSDRLFAGSVDHMAV